MSDDALIPIEVCICTFRRPQVTFTLRSLAEMQMPEGYRLHIIVADNDTQASAQVTIAAAAEQHQLNITYLHAPSANISIARNACFEAATADYMAFIDDDQIVSQEWLKRMMTRMLETQADVVLGPVQALYAEGTPAWLMHGDFHSNAPVWERGKITTGYTCNVLMRRHSAAIAPLRFDVALGVSGGEDTDFFSQAYARGAVIEFAADALVLEGVPENRANLRWLLKRRYRYGQTHAMVLRRKGFALVRAAVAAGKAACCFAMVLLSCLSPVGWRSWLLRGTLHLAVARSLLGHDH